MGWGKGRDAGTKFVGYVPTLEATALASEVSRVPILSGSRIGSEGFRILARLPAGAAPDGTAIREIGIYLKTGQLLCLWSDPVLPIAFTSSLSDFDIGFQLTLTQLPVDRLTLTVLEPDIPDTAAVLAEMLAMHARTFIETSRVNRRLDAARIAGV